MTGKVVPFADNLNAEVIRDRKELEELRERIALIKVKYIKPPGLISKTSLGQFYQFLFKQELNPLEELELMQATIAPDELNSKYTGIFNTIAVVGGLIIAFGFTATQTRLGGSEDVTTMRGSIDIEIIKDIYGLVIGISMATSFILVICAAFMSIQLSQIPSKLTTRFFENLGFVRVQGTFSFYIVALIGFMLATMIQISVNYAPWSIIAVFVTLIIFVFCMLYLIITGQLVRIDLLRQEYADIQEKLQRVITIKKDRVGEEGVVDDIVR